MRYAALIKADGEGFESVDVNEDEADCLRQSSDSSAAESGADVACSLSEACDLEVRTDGIGCSAPRARVLNPSQPGEHISRTDSKPSDALHSNATPYTCVQDLPAELASLIEAWPQLDASTQRAVVAVVKAGLTSPSNGEEA